MKFWKDFDEEGNNGHYCIGPDQGHPIAVTCGTTEGAKERAAILAQGADTFAALVKLADTCEALQVDLDASMSGWYYQFKQALHEAQMQMRKVRDGQS